MWLLNLLARNESWLTMLTKMPSLSVIARIQGRAASWEVLSLGQSDIGTSKELPFRLTWHIGVSSL